jgi:hypothetical protein
MTATKKFQAGRGYTKREWDAVSNNPEATDEQLAKAKPFKEVFPELAKTIRRRALKNSKQAARRKRSLTVEAI